MITLALTTLLCCAAQGAEVSSRLEPAPGKSAATGEPLHWTVTVSGRDSGAAALDGSVEFGPEWAVLEGPTPVVDSTVAASARPGLELRWTLMGLEAGEVATPVARIRIGEEELVDLEPARIELAGALGDEEDMARPLVGFREVEEEDVGDANLVLLAAAALVLAAFLPLIRRAGRRTAGAEPTPDRAPDLLERIAEERELSEEWGTQHRLPSLCTLAPLPLPGVRCVCSCCRRPDRYADSVGCDHQCCRRHMPRTQLLHAKLLS